MRRRLQRCRERDRERDEVFSPSPPIDAAKIQFNRRVANKAQGVCIYIYIYSQQQQQLLVNYTRHNDRTRTRPKLPLSTNGMFLLPLESRSVRLRDVRPRYSVILDDLSDPVPQENERLNATNDIFYSCFALLLPPFSLSLI